MATSIATPHLFGEWVVKEIAGTPVASFAGGICTLEYQYVTFCLELVERSGLPAALCVAKATVADRDCRIHLCNTDGRHLGNRCRVELCHLGDEVATKLRQDFDAAVTTKERQDSGNTVASSQAEAA